MKALGQYELFVRLGSGGAANVFLGRDTTPGADDRLVALKVLLPQLSADREALAMFFSEARIAARLGHPNIVGIAGFGRVEGVHCLAMEYVFGATLAEVLAESARVQQPLTVGVILTIMTRICEALHFAHALENAAGDPLHVVHRDVTAQNIMISFDGVPKLADFGLAKVVGRGFETQAGVVKGKFAYVSPEQSLGKKVDRRSDVFSAGIVLWEALTGEPLFDAPSVLDTLRAIRERPIQPPSEVAPGLSPLVDPIVMKALQRSPDARYQSAAEFQRDLDELVQSAGINIDSNAIAMELANIYGATIAERALVLRSAMAGEADEALLALALGCGALNAAQIPLVPGGTSDPDPLGLFAAREPSPKPARRKSTIAARSTAEFESVSREALMRNLSAVDAGQGAPSRSALDSLHELEFESQQPHDPAAIVEGWDRTDATLDSSAELLALISREEARDKRIPERFNSRFGGALATLTDDQAVTAIGPAATVEPATIEDMPALPFVEPEKITQPDEPATLGDEPATLGDEPATIGGGAPAILNRAPSVPVAEAALDAAATTGAPPARRLKISPMVLLLLAVLSMAAGSLLTLALLLL